MLPRLAVSVHGWYSADNCTHLLTFSAGGPVGGRGSEETGRPATHPHVPRCVRRVYFGSVMYAWMLQGMPVVTQPPSIRLFFARRVVRVTAKIKNIKQSKQNKHKQSRLVHSRLSWAKAPTSTRHSIPNALTLIRSLVIYLVLVFILFSRRHLPAGSNRILDPRRLATEFDLVVTTYATLAKVRHSHFGIYCSSVVLPGHRVRGHHLCHTGKGVAVATWGVRDCNAFNHNLYASYCSLKQRLSRLGWPHGYVS